MSNLICVVLNSFFMGLCAAKGLGFATSLNACAACLNGYIVARKLT